MPRNMGRTVFSSPFLWFAHRVIFALFRALVYLLPGVIHCVFQHPCERSKQELFSFSCDPIVSVVSIKHVLEMFAAEQLRSHYQKNRNNHHFVFFFMSTLLDKVKQLPAHTTELFVITCSLILALLCFHSGICPTTTDSQALFHENLLNYPN